MVKSVQIVKPREGIVVALAGNPNCGKTCIFNNLTGSHQHVGNWPGVTVEKKEGRFIYDGEIIRVTDLPGTYSLGAYSEDEKAARDYILSEDPDVIVNIVDATNLERNLYLTLQLLEMGANVVMALNMYDEAKALQTEIDIPKMSKFLGIPIVPTIAVHNKGMKEMIDRVVDAAQKRCPVPLRINYGKEIEKELEDLEANILIMPQLSNRYNARWLAVKLLEKDAEVLNEVRNFSGAENLLKARDDAVQRLENIWGEEVDSLIADRRYEFIEQIEKQTINRRQSIKGNSDLSDRIDKVVTNKYMGLPIFLLAMYCMFQFTFKIGDPIRGYFGVFFDWLGRAVGGLLANWGTSDLITSLVVDGIIKGAGSVLVFIPQIFLLFFAISLMEDSGYMARAAYVVDRFMHMLGLHGKSFIPLLVGFGCNTPAIMATRTLENKQDRLITILINPLMSCTARLPVYVLFAGTFFGARQGIVIFSIYLLGIVLAVIMGVLFKKLLFKGESSYFVMELPPYRIPTLKSTFLHVWERGGAFIHKAGTIIFLAVVLIWVLSTMPFGVEYASQQSVLGRIGSFVAPLFKPAGFGTWEAAVALIFGVMAKEIVVGTLGVIYGVQENALPQAIVSRWTPLSAYSFMVMTLIYVPCIAAIGAIRRETNSWGWAAFTVVYTLILGWIMSTLIYQAGTLLGLG